MGNCIITITNYWRGDRRDVVVAIDGRDDYRRDNRENNLVVEVKSLAADGREAVREVTIPRPRVIALSSTW